VDQRPLMQRLRAEADNIAAAMVAAIVTEIVAYAELDDTELALLREDVGHIVDESLALIAQQRPFTEQDLAIFVAKGERRALKKFPIADFVRAHSVAAVAAQRKFWEIATDHDWAEVLPASGWIGTQVPRAIKAGAIGYAGARTQVGHVGPAHQLVAKRLLEGQPVDDLVDATGLRMAPAYGVLVCPLVGEDCVPRYERELWETLGAAPDALMMVTLNEVVVLLPLIDSSADGVATCRAVAGGLVEALAGRTHERMSAALVAASGVAGVPAAAVEARTLCGLIQAMPDARTRVYSVTDLLIEKSIADDQIFAAELAHLLSPLRGGVGLPETLVTFIANDLDRERTAAALHIHRRTLSYRLTRISELTDVDPRSVHGIALLRAAVVASRLVEAGRAAEAGRVTAVGAG
jgi:hypothetical protein